MTTVLSEQDQVDSQLIETEQEQTPSKGLALNNTRLRYTMLILACLMAGWLAFTVQSSIWEIEAEVEMIYNSIVTPTN